MVSSSHVCYCFEDNERTSAMNKNILYLSWPVSCLVSDYISFADGEPVRTQDQPEPRSRPQKTTLPQRDRIRIEPKRL
jgi:hypothetical protein